MNPEVIVQDKYDTGPPLLRPKKAPDSIRIVLEVFSVTAWALLRTVPAAKSTMVDGEAACESFSDPLGHTFIIAARTSPTVTGEQP